MWVVANAVLRPCFAATERHLCCEHDHWWAHGAGRTNRSCESVHLANFDVIPWIFASPFISTNPCLASTHDSFRLVTTLPQGSRSAHALSRKEKVCPAAANPTGRKPKETRRTRITPGHAAWNGHRLRGCRWLPERTSAAHVPRYDVKIRCKVAVALFSAADESSVIRGKVRQTWAP
ncbi:hypothetical protein PHLGIDRAFT_30611, partial [Phlebiopsis gigantea 11061_1 CR5-6]